MLKNQSYQWLFINDCFSEKMLVIRKEKWKKVKELRDESKYAVLVYNKMVLQEKISPDSSACVCQWDLRFLNLVFQSYCGSEQLWEWKNVEKLSFYPLSTKDFSLKNDINPDTNLSNDAKFQKPHSYYTVDKLIKFSSKSLKDFFSSKQRYELKFERTQIKFGRPHSESH